MAHLHDKELEEAEAAVVGDRVEPGVRHCDVGHLRPETSDAVNDCSKAGFTLGISALIPLIMVLTASKVTRVIPILGTCIERKIFN